MSTDFLPFSRPGITEQDIHAVSQVLRSGWITTGQQNSRFEQAICARLGCQHAIAMTSATAAMQLVLHAFNMGPGDEVITPSMTWISTVNLITLAGGQPVFIDIDRDNLMTTAEQIEAAITPSTGLIIPVHFAGAALDLAPIRALAKKRGIPLIEDAAHALGTDYQGQAIGQQGTSILSFHPTKNITSGEGGMVCTDNAALADQLRQLRFHGLGSHAYDRHTQTRAPQAEVLAPGFKTNLPDMNAALGLSQLGRLDQFIQRRTELAEHYLSRLGEVPEISPLALPDTGQTHAWHLFIVRLDIDNLSIGRDEFIVQLKAHGVGAGVHFRAVHQHRWYRQHQPTPSGILPHTEWNSDRVLSLPLFPDMQNSDVDRVVSALQTTIKEYHS